MLHLTSFPSRLCFPGPWFVPCERSLSLIPKKVADSLESLPRRTATNTCGKTLGHTRANSPFPTYTGYSLVRPKCRAAWPRVSTTKGRLAHQTTVHTRAMRRKPRQWSTRNPCRRKARARTTLYRCSSLKMTLRPKWYVFSLPLILLPTGTYPCILTVSEKSCACRAKLPVMTWKKSQPTSAAGAS